MPEQKILKDPYTLPNGEHGMGNCLVLSVRGVTKLWKFQQQRNKISYRFAFAHLDQCTLEQAQRKVIEYKDKISKGADPRDGLHKTNPITLSDLFHDWWNTRAEHSYKNPDQEYKRKSSLLKLYCNLLLNRPFATITQNEWNDMLVKTWKSGKKETTRKIAILLSAIWELAKQLRLLNIEDVQYGNPFLWKNSLSNILKGGVDTTPYKAIEYQKTPDFYNFLCQQKKITPTVEALKLLILTSCRSNEVINAKWDEFDLENKLWIIPASRMKMGVQHKIPLSDQAIKVLKERKERDLHNSPFLFSMHGEKPLHSLQLMQWIRTHANEWNTTVHGFRSCFKSWAEDADCYSDKTIEYSLAHYPAKGSLDRAYMRSIKIESRQTIMKDWGNFVCGGNE